MRNFLLSPSLLLIVFLGAISSQSRALEPFESLQWGLHNDGTAQNIELDDITTFKVQARPGIDIQKPSELNSSAKKILVAVLDTGIDFDHPDLKNVIHRNESECKALDKFLVCAQEKSRADCEKIWMDLSNPEVDQDHNGYPLDCHGWSILGSVNAAGIMGRPDFQDEQGHGSHVAGIIAAQSGNGLGISGVSSQVEILPVQVLGLKPSEPLKPLSLDLSPTEKGKEAYRNSLGDMVARGVIYAIRSGAQVINFSMGWPESNDSPYLRQVIQEAQKKGILIVAAAGNDSTRALLRPCSYPGVICVAAHGPDGSLSHFSNYGSGVEVAAPGTNILSTWPLNKRPVRFRKTLGYEYLHGTSQATPFVTGMVAEMLAQGIRADEIYQRLVLGSRPLEEKLPLLEGASHRLEPDHDSAQDQLIEKKWILSGIVSLKNSLEVKAQPLILPANKEKEEVPWNRRDQVLNLRYPLQNFWQDVDMSQVQISTSFLKPSSAAIRPEIISTIFENATSSSNMWRRGEVRTLVVQVRISDTKEPAQSRIPSDLDLLIETAVLRQKRRFVMEKEIVVPIQSDTTTSIGSDLDMEVIPLEKMPPMRTNLVSFDQNFDGNSRTDYLAIGEEKKTRFYYLIRQNSSKAYQSQGLFKVDLGDDLENTREQITARLAWSQDQEPGYVLGLFTDRSEQEDAFSALKIHYLNARFELQKTFEIKNDQVQVPMRVSWLRYRGIKVPSWIGRGKDPDKKSSVKEDWENPQGYEKAQIRFYFLSESGKLKAISDYQDYRFIDILDPTLPQIQQGRVPVVLAKNQGTSVKPSYIYDFAVAEIFEGQVVHFQKIDLSLDQRTYRNLLDTRVDQVLNLNKTQDLGRGTFWFGEGPARSQRLSLLVPDFAAGELPRYQFFDSILPASRGTVDSTLWVRAAYLGSSGYGAFALTNSEIQYHDLGRQQVAVKSFERYTFYESMAFTNLHFPIALSDREHPGQKIPAMFTTENSGLNRGVKFKTISRDSDGNLIEITSPASLHFKTEKGCRSLDNPVTTEDSEPALDYYCGNKILRVKLSY